MPTTDALNSKSSTARPRYDEYVDSGVDWLSKIPAHWKPTRLRFLVELSPSKNEVRDLPKDEKVSFVPMEAIRENGGLALEQTRELGPVIDGYTYFQEGDVLVAKITPCFENRKGAFASNLQNGIGFGTTELHVLRPNEGMDGRYLFYVTMSHPFRKRGESTMYGAGGQKRVSDDFIRNLEWPIPPLDEQRAIAAYLDRETERIDALIEKKEQLIDLLEEKRKSLISRVVTKGLDDDVEMQNSGVEWLGEIPAHWEGARLKFVAQLETGHTPSRSEAEYWENRTIPWVTLSDVGKLRSGRVDYIYETEEKISELGLANSSARLLPKGTVILSRTASVGFSAILGKPMATTQDFVNWICGDSLLPKYLLYCFRSMRQEFDRITDGSTHKTIYMPEVEQFRIPLPPIESQKTIVEHLDEETGRIDSLVNTIQDGIKQLKEYRTALISAAVTGQIDVREATDKPVKQQYS